MAAHFHECLGWDDFIEGQKCAIGVEIRAQKIHAQGLKRGTDFWAHGLMHCLLELELTHQPKCDSTYEHEGERQLGCCPPSHHISAVGGVSTD